MQLPEPPERARLSKDEWLGSIGVFLIVFVSTFPVVIPFIFMQNVGPALRVSNAIAIVMLFLTGYAFGRIDRASPVAGGYCDGGARVRARRHDHGTGRMSHVRLLACLAIAIAFMDGAVARPGPDERAHLRGDDHAAAKPTKRRGPSPPPPTPTSFPTTANYVQPTFTADRGWLHLEARYNYEALDTGSAWVGYNFSGGEKLAWEFTPMIGGVFGDTTGIAPGYKGSLSWWKLELYSEGEYVFDTRQHPRTVSSTTGRS